LFSYFFLKKAQDFNLSHYRCAMTANTEVIILAEAAIAAMNTDTLIELLAQKTAHLLVVCHCKVPDNIVVPLRKEVKLIQAEIMRRGKAKAR
jgi:hypothetical protein